MRNLFGCAHFKQQLLIILSLTVLSAGQAPIPPTELEQAKNETQFFCNAWKALQFDTVFSRMTEAIQVDTTQVTFINSYGILSGDIAKLTSFSVIDALSNENDIIVKVALAFDKEVPPTIVNGIHNFHLTKENGMWKVKTIVPPIAPPGDIGSGGHPG